MHDQTQRRRILDGDITLVPVAVEDLTQADIQRMILAATARYETAVIELAQLGEDAARAEATYRVDVKRAYLNAVGPVATREAQATVDCETSLLQRELTQARLKAQYEVLHHLKSQLDALRTLAADFRSQVS